MCIENINKINLGLNNLFKKRKPKLKVHYQGKRPVSDEEYNQQRSKVQKQIDIILDKISKSGYESLTKEEKEILFNMSKK